MKKIILMAVVSVLALAGIAFASVGTDQLTDGAVTTPKLADGAVTTKKVGFLRNVIVVALQGGDFANPATAAASITSASETNQYLIRIMPGVYDLGGAMNVPSFVEVEGSGKVATKLIGSVSCGPNSALRSLSIENLTGGGLSVNSATVTNVSVKAMDVGISAYGKTTISSSEVEAGRLSSLESIGIMVANSSSEWVTLTDVTAVANGTNGGIDGYGVKNFYSKVRMNSVTAIAQSSPSVTNWAVHSIGWGAQTIIENSTLKAIGHYNQYGVTNLYGSKTTITNTTIVTEDPAGGGSNVGIFINDGVVTVDHSSITGSRSVLNQPGGSTSIGYTKIDGGPMYSAEPYLAVGVKCIGNYTADYTPYVCP